MKTNCEFHFLYYLLLSLFMFLHIKSKAQCSEIAEAAVNNKCAYMTWEITPPSSFPESIIINGTSYTFDSENGNSAKYINDDAPNGNGCNNYDNLNGDIVLGNTLCTYEEGLLVSSSPLPVSLIYFKSALHEGSGKLTWATASELNNKGFEVEKSSDGLRWAKITWIDGAGTTNENQYYEFVDDDLLPGINYYRLKQLDYDGTFSYSHVESTFLGNNKEIEITIFPNPTKDVVIISNLDEYSVENINIYNQLGQHILQPEIKNNVIDVSHLEKGVFILVVKVEGLRIIERLAIK